MRVNLKGVPLAPSTQTLIMRILSLQSFTQTSRRFRVRPDSRPGMSGSVSVFGIDIWDSRMATRR